MVKRTVSLHLLEINLVLATVVPVHLALGVVRHAISNYVLLMTSLVQVFGVCCSI